MSTPKTATTQATPRTRSARPSKKKGQRNVVKDVARSRRENPIELLTDNKRRQRFSEIASKTESEAVLPLMRPPPRKAKGGTTKPTIRSKAPMRAPLEQYLRHLAKPFTTPPVKCPINYNPVPSLMTSLAKTTSLTEINVAINSTTQFAFWPGHGAQSDADSMDGFSYHSANQLINATAYSMGPVQVGGNAAAVGAYTTSLSYTTASSGTNNATSVPIVPDIALPYTASSGNGGHTRWKLVSMGLRLINLTPISTRAGEVITVQTSSPFSAATQREFSAFPSFQITNKEDDEIFEMSWTPRLDDLAFWHSDSSLSTNTSYSGAGLFLWFNNQSASIQSISLQVVCHWEMGGSNLVSISTPSVCAPSDKNILEPALDVVRFSAPDSSSIATIGNMVSHAISGVTGAARGEIAKAIPSATEFMVDTIMSLF